MSSGRRATPARVFSAGRRLAGFIAFDLLRVRMLNVDGLLLDSLDSSDASGISLLARVAPDLLSLFPYALLTRLDSLRRLHLDIPSIRSLIDHNGLEFESIGNQLATSGATIAHMARDLDFFTGFDEVWFFDCVPGSPVPSELTIRTAEIVRPEYAARRPSALESLKDVARWMADSGAILGVADGLGLDFVTTDPSVALQIEMGVSGSTREITDIQCTGPAARPGEAMS